MKPPTGKARQCINGPLDGKTVDWPARAYGQRGSIRLPDGWDAVYEFSGGGWYFVGYELEFTDLHVLEPHKIRLMRECEFMLINAKPPWRAE